MKKSILLTVLALMTLVSCTDKRGQNHPSWAYDAVVYEMNVRQYTPEGTFAAAQAELPRLKDLGVDAVWLMPVYPIGEKGRKGSLGSYYAIRDYFAVNPEFGTLDDFDNFVSEAHRLGLKVVLDWVANHTSPDAVWIESKPLDYYERDSLGNTIVEYDWTDIAALNYENMDMRADMMDAMQFWADRNIDGFRCDMAFLMPQDFWTEAIGMIKGQNPDFYFLAEGEEPWLHEAGFDASYSWELHHLLNDIAQGRKGKADLLAYLEKNDESYPDTAFRLMFISNHDENSWAGTEFERMGDAVKAMAVLCYTLPQGQPLIYTGQEVGLNRRFEFFEKDIAPDWTANEWTEFYKEMNALRHDNPALASGEKGGMFGVLESDDSTFAFIRSMEGNTVEVSVQLCEPWNYSIKVF